MTVEEIFRAGLKHHHYANTAYPLRPSSFKEFRVKDTNLIRKHIEDDLERITELGLYVHIPFCEKRCRFCEYVVLSGEESFRKEKYVESLLDEIQLYGDLGFGGKVIGLDLGGGTPTVLSEQELGRVTGELLKQFSLPDGIGMSIETTPSIAATSLEKLRQIRKMGYRRISMGVQSINTSLLKSFDREGTVQVVSKAVENIRTAGFARLNIDLMYGFLNQSVDDFRETLVFTIGLQPEYVTLYRNRYKGTRLEGEAKQVTLEAVNRQYDLAFEMLNKHGYVANVGKNTFSKIVGDYGTSDYLTKRVIEGTPYIGMGLGAQSFGLEYLVYNQGAASKRGANYYKQIEQGEFPIQDFYKLPVDEQISKMISVAFYFGYIDLRAFERRFQVRFRDVFAKQIDFLVRNGLLHFQGDNFTLTKKGHNNINGIIPLFHSVRSQIELLQF